MRSARGARSGAVLLIALAGCAGHSTTRPGVGDEPANEDPKVGNETPEAPDGIDRSSPIASIDDKINPEATPGTAVGTGGSADPGTEVPTPAGTTVSVVGPQAEYVLATFAATSGPDEISGSAPGQGWVSEQSLDADHAELAVPGSATAAAALVSANGALVDAAVSTCGSRPPASARVLFVPGGYDTIQAALDAAQPGDTVSVAAGVYTEHLRLRPFVRLVGAGASVTILDGLEVGESLIDFTGATAAVVSGFTLRNVGQRDTCADTAPTDCSGDWYAAAVYADGHENACGAESSLLFTRNVVMGNDIGFLLYFQARAIVTNNVFVGNHSAFVANHHQDHALVAQNVFYGNDSAAIIAQASYLNVIGNVLLGNGAAFAQEYVQRGFVGCNVVSDNESLGEGFLDGGYVELDPQFVAPEELDFRLAPGSLAAGLGCLGAAHDVATDPGAFGGPLGAWTP